MNLKSTLILFSVFTLQAMTATSQIYKLLIGTYTTGKSEGVYVYDFDTRNGEFAYRNKATAIQNPSYLAVSDDRQNVYAVNELGNGKGTVTALAFDNRTGQLRAINQEGTNGDDPCYIETDKGKRHVFTANYSGGNLTVFPVKRDGSLGRATQTIQHTGSGPNKSRQEKPHVHMAILSPDERYLLTNDLGTDKVTVYGYDPEAAAPLKLFSTYQGKPGSGPRHLTFHPTKSFVYLLNELSGDITALQFHDGQLKMLQSASPVAGFKGKSDAADIHISPDGKFLYASYRGDLNELVIYSVNEKDGKLTYAGKQKTGGIGPRNFAIDPTGNFLLVAHQKSDDIRIFSRDKKTGQLTLIADKKIEVGSPVCLRFVKTD
jgi:6-phosphogluconolactonase